MSTSPTLKPGDLAFVADALLSLCEKTPDRPCYSEEALWKKLRLAERREPLVAHLMSRRGDDPLLRSECAALVAQSGLTTRQRDVLRRRIEGWTFEEIGRSSGHSKQAAQHVFVQAIKKLTRAVAVYPFTGLSEVYRRETRRGLSRSGLGRMPMSAS